MTATKIEKPTMLNPSICAPQLIATTQHSVWELIGYTFGSKPIKNTGV
ncbi:hypothetical protein Q0590_14480 [Rhodocytophaga aerolata]|uniref:Uncharacterized protein n=1 Tax=Rhodocytophaga aerolata TaxID=455078 RepID=A0ABT8R5U5_9BACT|nr:hypothetical protein [Rhodocytophaga aerolata]MDO1447471.1 hypothetical protein [Rhodocytophaga aerolata]